MFVRKVYKVSSDWRVINEWRRDGEPLEILANFSESRYQDVESGRSACDTVKYDVRGSIRVVMAVKEPRGCGVRSYVL